MNYTSVSLDCTTTMMKKTDRELGNAIKTGNKTLKNIA